MNINLFACVYVCADVFCIVFKMIFKRFLGWGFTTHMLARLCKKKNKHKLWVLLRAILCMFGLTKTLLVIVMDDRWNSTTVNLLYSSFCNHAQRQGRNNKKRSVIHCFVVVVVVVVADLYLHHYLIVIEICTDYLNYCSTSNGPNTLWYNVKDSFQYAHIAGYH